MVARFLADGQYDTPFVASAKFQGFRGTSQAVATTAEGRIITVGNTKQGNKEYFAIAAFWSF